MLHYALYPNELTPDDPNDQIARPVDLVPRTLQDLVQKVTGPGSILKSTEVKAVVDAYWKAIADYTRAGEVYSDEFMATRLDISGVFQNEDDRFDPTRHSLVVGVRLKEPVASAVQDVKLRKVDARKSRPLIDSVYDWGSDLHNERLTPQDVLEINGETLKIHHNLEEEGIFFINQANGQDTKAPFVRTNEPKTLTTRVPALSPGQYRLEVRNTRHDGKTLRIGVFTPTLVVS